MEMHFSGRELLELIAFCNLSAIENERVFSLQILLSSFSLSSFFSSFRRGGLERALCWRIQSDCFQPAEGEKRERKEWEWCEQDLGDMEV